MGNRRTANFGASSCLHVLHRERSQLDLGPANVAWPHPRRREQCSDSKAPKDWGVSLERNYGASALQSWDYNQASGNAESHTELKSTLEDRRLIMLSMGYPFVFD
jgi:hypothetical protein